ncbi:MAG: site-2 protease family protein [Deltaproteobacteria bacterium]|nr:site-2 protease family protein [Deltaproteobacteria bacterium]
MQDGFFNVVLLVPVFLFSLCVHEYAHGWVAVKRGDATPMLLGRLTLHPMAHADLVGTLLLPIICIYNGWPFFGWAKPVPVDTQNFKHGRRDMALVAFAGPLANIILAILSTVALGFLVRLPLQSKVLQTTELLSVVMIQVNLMLAFFNLIPIPPLDGYRILQGFLSPTAAFQIERLEPYANILLLVLLISGGLQFIGAPVIHVFRWLLFAAGAI